MNGVEIPHFMEKKVKSNNENFFIPDYLGIDIRKTYDNNKSVKIFEIKKKNDSLIETQLHDYEKIVKDKIFKATFEQKKDLIFSITNNKIFYYDKNLNIVSKGDILDLVSEKFKLFLLAENVICRKERSENYEVIYKNNKEEDIRLKDKYKNKIKLVSISFKKENTLYNLLIDSDLITFRKDDGKVKTQIEMQYTADHNWRAKTIHLPLFLLKFEAIDKFMSSDLLKEFDFKIEKNQDFDTILLRNNTVYYSRKNVNIKNSLNGSEAIIINGYNQKNDKATTVKEGEEIYMRKLINSTTILASKKLEIKSNVNKKITISNIEAFMVDEKIGDMINFLRESGLENFGKDEMEMISLMNDNMYEYIKVRQNEASQTLSKRNTTL